MSHPINTQSFSTHLRKQTVDLVNKRLMVSNFYGTTQEKDLTEPANCNGFGRIRHFRRHSGAGWPDNPLPIDPACKALGLSITDTLKAQVFQSAACNWRCWYCFVPFKLLSANPKHSGWLRPADLIDLYLAQEVPPSVIDLTGGQPDLVPEWVPWMMSELRARGLEKSVYLWSDDNLSNDYFWRFLSHQERNLIASYPMYGKVCCFKGFDSTSFAFNTKAEPELWDQQFELMDRFIQLGIDLYAYATFTTAHCPDISSAMKIFMDRLQKLHINLPLRIVPLKIQLFTTVLERDTPNIPEALRNQQIAIEIWQQELEERYSIEERAKNIADVSLR
jgi:uncharacterized Fe-S cluster-containing radical SAM superfamily protein